MVPGMSLRPQAGPFALYPLRVGLALVFLYTGTEKLLDVEANAAIAAFIGVPWPRFVTVAVGVIEVLGALAIFLGIGTRTAAVALSVLMLFVLWTLKVPGTFWGDGWGIDVAVLAGTATLALNGPGRPTVQGILARREAHDEKGTRAPMMRSNRPGPRRQPAIDNPAAPEPR